MDKVIHSSRKNLGPVLKYELKICPRHFGFHPYRSSINRSLCKHLQDMPVKVADRGDTGGVDANLTGSLDI